MLATPFEFTMHNWRKFENTGVILSQVPMCIVDQNGSGKTSLIAALYSLCTGKSWPGLTFKQLLKNGENYFGVSADSDWYLNGTLSTSGRMMTKFVNETETKIPVMTYLPTDNQWFFVSRAQKLAILDTLLSQAFSSAYEIPLTNLNKALKQKNALLKHYLEIGADDTVLAKEYTQQIYANSQKLWIMRDAFFENINNTLCDYYNWIESKEIFELKLLRTTNHNKSYQKIGNSIIEPDFDDLWLREKHAQRLLFGAQRDDFDYFCGFNQIGSLLSRGEMRLFVLFLKYTAMKLHQHSADIVWLLDDIFNEFDQKREAILFESLLMQSNAFIATSTKEPSIDLSVISMDQILIN